jgi:hypothetical protein
MLHHFPIIQTIYNIKNTGDDILNIYFLRMFFFLSTMYKNNNNLDKKVLMMHVIIFVRINI